MKNPRLWPIAVATCLLLTGCAEEAPPAEPQTDAEVIQYWLDVAHDKESSEQQIAVLERALERGTVLRADINEVLPEYYDCLEDIGLTYYFREEETVPGSGVSVPGVSAVMPTSDEGEQEALGALMDACTEKYESFIEAAYREQPTSREAEDRVWTGAAMRDCLTEHGFTVDDDATAAEIRALWDDDLWGNIDDSDFYAC
jgi:hypothetical protein